MSLTLATVPRGYTLTGNGCAFMIRSVFAIDRRGAFMIRGRISRHPSPGCPSPVEASRLASPFRCATRPVGGTHTRTATQINKYIFAHTRAHKKIYSLTNGGK